MYEEELAIREDETPSLSTETWERPLDYSCQSYPKKTNIKCRLQVGVVHPGNVASDLLSAEEVERREATEGFITADDVAACVLTMARLPLGANVLELTVMPTRQPLIGRG